MEKPECPAVQYNGSYIYLIWAMLATIFAVGAVIKILFNKKLTKSNGHGYTKLKQFPEEETETEHYRRLYEEERREKEKALERLSKIMSTRLTDGNPNIANLSDEKRPTKLAEEYSELYDNAWSDAFESISKIHESKTKIDFLRQILQICFKWCSERSADQLKQLDNLLHCAGFPLDDLVDQRPISRDFLKNFKDERKQLGKESAECITKEILTKVSNEFKNTVWHSEIHQASVKTYSEQCAKLCWLMVVQDPSMEIGFSITDIHQYKAYTRSGHQIDYVVWPPLFLHKGGNLMSKGIAQMK